tara:strand:+ start:109 stop:609 length:501 start_codon:yes stop_codon:yes gene_type:complete
MNFKSIKNIFFILFSSLFFVSCSQKNSNFDIDLSDLPKPKKIKINDQLKKDTETEDNQLFISELVPFEDREKLLSKSKFGKKDPFSEGETKVNQFSLDFKLTGFLNTEIEKYVFVSYLGNEGTISEDAIGGLNTNLLPDGAKVITIDYEERQLKISFDNEDFIFEM